jgi:hypothetical protein
MFVFLERNGILKNEGRAYTKRTRFVEGAKAVISLPLSRRAYYSAQGLIEAS